MMNKCDLCGFLLVFMVLGFLLSGCSNTQPKTTVKKNNTQYQYIDSNVERNAGADYYKQLGLTYYEYHGYNENDLELSLIDLRFYGTHNDSDGKAYPLTIDILVDKNKIEEVKKDIVKLKNLLVSVKRLRKNSSSYNRSCSAYRNYQWFLEDKDRTFIGLKKSVNLENTICLEVKTHPGMEASATIELRKLNSIVYAARPTFAAGGAVEAIKKTDFESKGEAYLQKQNQLDNIKLTKNQDDSLKSNFVSKK